MPTYRYRDDVAPIAPDFARVARALPDDELEEEILAGLGEPDYQLALVAERERRANQPKEA